MKKQNGKGICTYNDTMVIQTHLIIINTLVYLRYTHIPSLWSSASLPRSGKVNSARSHIRRGEGGMALQLLKHIAKNNLTKREH